MWWSARRLTRPFRFLANASLALGEDPGMAPLPVVGPQEVRMATAAFNHMRAQLAHHVSERATLMAALAHDLRTPLTGIRIRAEMMPESGRCRMAADIHRLDELVSDMLI
ncbi:histidine kinase dimerization/phospho-acceptor domain-containing protein, partial [Staphylococcus aureus]|uniref:histidine kinase dimerization/phospho-acceptor domain-containing protein n=1 Tax=Staphylococcus aureus TaxID=1280 RepID=UPI0039BECB3B